MTSQKQRLLSKLEINGTHGICGTLLLRDGIPRYAARISDLRAEGHIIDTLPCNNRFHTHQTRQIRYVLTPPSATLF